MNIDDSGTRYVVVKMPQDDRQVTVDFAPLLNTGETILAGAITYTNPSGTLNTSLLANNLTNGVLNISGGLDKQSYGVVYTINTNQGRLLSQRIAVVVNQDIAYEFQNTNPDAFTNLVGSLEAGDAAVGSCSFLFPTPFDASTGSVTWEMLDSNGVTYSSGGAHSYEHEIVTNQVRVSAQAVINAPSDMVPTLAGQNYQIRWCLQIGSQRYYSTEALTVTAPNTVPVGVQDVVELQGNDIPITVIFDEPFEYVQYEVYNGNDLIIGAQNAQRGTKVADGYLYAAAIQSPLNMPSQLEPYTIVWSAWNPANEQFKMRQTGKVFVINTSILAATDDMRLMINRSRATIANAQDLIFEVPTLISFLRRGRDQFNGAHGILTGFTMVNASGSVRDYWLRYSEVMALRSQYLAEGEKAFNFSGQAIQLDVDKSQFYSQLADNLQSQIDNEVKPFKQNLIIKGIVRGDGNLGPDGGTLQRRGAAGAVGITLTPASSWGKYAGRLGVFR